MIFSGLKEKQQKAYRLKSYDEILLNIVTSMFVYRGFPEELLTNFIDIYRTLNGACAIWNNDDKWIATEVDFGGTPDEYGIGTIAICTTKNGVVKQFDNWRENPDIAVFFNNSVYFPDMNIGRFSDMLTEVEVSMKLNVLYSRMYPIPVTHDGKTKSAIDVALENIMNGKMSTILTEDVLAQFTEGDNSGIDLINLTDVQKSQNIQYLSKYRDDLFRWFYSLYGMNSQGSSKLAQQTVDEVNQDSNSSMIIPHDMLHQAQLGCEMCNTKFGWNTEVSFSECWQSRLAQCDEEFSDVVDLTEEETKEEETKEEENQEEETNIDNEEEKDDNDEKDEEEK